MAIQLTQNGAEIRLLEQQVVSQAGAVEAPIPHSPQPLPLRNRRGHTDPTSLSELQSEPLMAHTLHLGYACLDSQGESSDFLGHPCPTKPPPPLKKHSLKQDGAAQKSLFLDLALPFHRPLKGQGGHAVALLSPGRPVATLSFQVHSLREKMNTKPAANPHVDRSGAG